MFNPPLLPAPQLDDRRFQDIVDETKKRIPAYTAEWTDHNVSDPGVTLIELFAWMIDMLLYRLNQVPDKHYVRFMEMLGIRLQGPEPARAPVTFWLTATQETAAIIPAGTEVATTQTETEASIVFTTDGDFRVEPPQLAMAASHLLADGGQGRFVAHNLRRLSEGFSGLEVFSPRPRPNEALYFGFENDLSHHILGFDTQWDPAGGAQIDPTLPPYVWEAAGGADGREWLPCEVEDDRTRGLNSAGRILIHLPPLVRRQLNSRELYWVRIRVKEISPAEVEEGMLPYGTSPRLRQLKVAAWGGTTPATQAQKVERELLGTSDGTPGQRFRLQSAPVLQRRAGETLVVQEVNKPPEVWQEVNDFAQSKAYDRHFTLDSVSGEVRLGPAVRQPDGTMKRYGHVPPRQATLVFQRYRAGGGLAGNVLTGILNTLKTSIPYIARVSNRRPAWGGLDAESLEAAMMRAPALLRSRDRAVSESDFEFLARQAFPAAIGRVKCLQPRPSEAGRVAPGQVYVLVIPNAPGSTGYLSPEQLAFPAEAVAALQAYLDQRRLLTVRLDVRPPAYRWVAVKVQLRATPGADGDALRAEVLARLYRFLNPLKGGPAALNPEPRRPEEEGWPFGRELFASDVYQALQGIANVQFIRGLELYATTEGGGPQGKPVESLELVAHGVVASGRHEVEFV